ncbi:hypothetical protein JDW21_18920 [Bacillus subtilis]|uniref:Uncharacterized protein n=1 Tax=Bacillus phage vB_BsuS_PJN02 TaxID=2920374 RepID=A0AC61TTH8_9CAUD|nr:hypothetical protein [Bacillus subtilis]YP_010681816.1 hypothetical protein PQE76_gp198 [Bacillus phage vB_BsuS_PJN02]UNH58541.1 hypothetical protein [Bacillus phage vB_BsuS_PJN02]WOF32902.1 hypothetical protein OEJ84_23675 [Bacillus subtilis]
MKSIRKRFIVGLLSLVMFVSSVFVFETSARAQDSNRSYQKVYTIFDNNVPSSIQEIEKLLKDQVDNPSDGFTKEDAEKNYKTFMNMTDSEKENFLDIINNPKKLAAELEKSVNETVPTYTREVVNEATTSDAKQAKTITIRYSGNMKPTALGIHACTYHWSVELTTENREKAIEANKWKNHIGYKNPLFIFYDLSRINNDDYISKGKFYGKSEYSFKLGYKGIGLQVGRFKFNTTITPKKSGKKEVSANFKVELF